MTAITKSILRALLYFDIFGHPLTKEELYRMIGMKADWTALEQSLDDLQLKNLVVNDSGYLFIANGSSSVSERVKKNTRSKKYLRISRFISSLIYLNPFVEGVLISGSLSKSAFSKKDDIDFFIITKPGRLWLSKTILMVFKKIFLLNSKKYFCLNYFIDTDTLEIPDKNIFTATEIAFLIPLRNSELCKKFFETNAWIYSFFPNITIDLMGCKQASFPFSKRVLEGLLNGKLSDKADSWFMNLYMERSKNNHQIANEEQFRINFKNEKNVSKYHPNGFQHRVMQSYNLKITEFQVAHNLDLTV